MDDFRSTQLPRVDKPVLRLGMAANFGLSEAGIRSAAERGVNYWSWSPRMKVLTPVLRELLARDRDRHVVSVLSGVGYTAGLVRRKIDAARRQLGVDQLDLYLLPWLGRTSRLTPAIAEVLVRARDDGAVRAVGTSIHDRKRAGELARDSVLDVLMLRYNAKHPGAEHDVFPHLEARRPAVIAYTATSWRQLIRPLKGVEMDPWPGDGTNVPPMTAALCYRFCLSSPHVHVVLTGPANQQQLDENLAALDAGPLSDDEMAWVRDYGRKVKSARRLDYV